MATPPLLPLTVMPTKTAAIGTFDNGSTLDIFQVLSQNGSVAMHMLSTGSIDPPVYPQTAYITLSSAQLLALNSAPVILVPAPVAVYGPSTELFISPQYVAAQYIAGTVPYSGTTSEGTLTIGWGTTTEEIGDTFCGQFGDYNFVDQSTSQLYITLDLSLGGPVPLSEIIAQPLSIFLETDTLTDGNGTLLITLQYTTVLAST